MNTHSSFSRLFSTVGQILLYTLLIAVPLLVLPITQNLFDSSKSLLIVLASLLALIVWGIQILLKKQLTVVIHPFVLPLVFLNVVIAVSAWLSPVPIAESMSGFYGTWFLLNIFTLLCTQFVSNKNSRLFTEFSLAVGIVLSIIALLQTFQIGPSLFLNRLFGLQLPDNFLFTTSGSPFVTVIFLVVIAITTLVEIASQKKWKESLFSLAAVAVVILGIGLHLVQFVRTPTYRPNALSFAASWSIAVDGLKSAQSALVGYGPMGYIDAFTERKPVSLNATNQWLVVYQVGMNTPLTLMVTLGVLGTVAWLWMGVLAVKTVRHTPKQHLSPAILFITAWVVQLFVPFNLVLLTIQMIALAFWMAGLRSAENQSVLSTATFTPTTHEHLTAQQKQYRMIPLYFSAFVLFAVALGIGWYASRIALSEWFYFRSLQAAQQNDGNQTYQLQQQAIVMHPYRDQYRRSYAQTNFALANSLSSREDLSEQDKVTITQLLQQSLREARVATELNPRRSTNWKTLAEIYRAITGTTEGADQWAVAAYVQAIQTHPNDPTLRVDLGSVFYILQNYAQAEQLFRQAVQLKPDYANGYYNLANALKEQGFNETAILAYQETLKLLDPSSEDYIKAQAEMSALSDLVKTQETAQQSATATPGTTPSPSPTPRPTAEVNEPEEAELPESVSQAEIPNEEPNSPVLPSATPEPTQTP